MTHESNPPADTPAADSDSGPGYELRDTNVRAVVSFLVGLTLLIIVSQVLLWGLLRGMSTSRTQPSAELTTGYELRLMSPVSGVSGIPTTGNRLVIVANVKGVLHFRIFDLRGDRVVDTDETSLPGQARPIADLGKQLERLWPPHELTGSESEHLVATVTSIVGHPLTTRAMIPQLLDDLHKQEDTVLAGKNGMPIDEAIRRLAEQGIPPTASGLTEADVNSHAGIPASKDEASKTKAQAKDAPK